MSLAAHCGSNDGFVAAWYDQASSNDATQTDRTKQPKIYDGTTGVVTEDGKPHVYFTNDYLKSANTGDFSGKEQSVFFVVKETSSSGQFTGVGDNSITTGALRAVTPEPYLRFVGRTQDYNSHVDLNNQHLYSLVCPDTVTTIDDYDLYRNGTILTPDSLSGGSLVNLVGSDVTVGHAPTLSGVAYTGYMSECIWYNSDQSNNRTNIEDNINTFYSIF